MGFWELFSGELLGVPPSDGALQVVGEFFSGLSLPIISSHNTIFFIYTLTGELCDEKARSGDASGGVGGIN
jgi:hypothetical protein